MRFDKLIKLIVLTTTSDGLGGRTEVENVLYNKYANVEELSIDTTVKIYGEAITQNVKAIISGHVEKIDKIKIDDKSYKVVNQIRVKNKTSFFLEVEND